jgi:hypothetical protein
MNILYNGVLKGSISDDGGVTFNEDFMQEHAKTLFRSISQQEQDNGDVLLVDGEMGVELKISTLRELGFEVTPK